jgi:opacity protein-like surface antigen
MIGGKGEGVVGFHIEDENGFDVQAAYSPIRNLGATLDVSHVSAGSSGQRVSGLLVEGGAGYYRAFREHLLVDGYGLLGFGGVENELSSGNISANVVRFGIQPSAGFRSRFFDAFFASRLVGVHYFGIDGSDSTNVQSLRDAGTQYMFEPAVTLRAGYRVKLQLQAGRSYNLSSDSFPQEKDIISLGIVYTFRRD